MIEKKLTHDFLLKEKPNVKIKLERLRSISEQIARIKENDLADKREELAKLELEHDELWSFLNEYASSVAKYSVIANKSKAKKRLRSSYAMIGLNREKAKKP